MFDIILIVVDDDDDDDDADDDDENDVIEFDAVVIDVVVVVVIIVILGKRSHLADASQSHGILQFIKQLYSGLRPYKKLTHQKKSLNLSFKSKHFNYF